MATTSSMFMYSFTVQPSSAPSCAILGQFTGTKEQLIITASGSRITLHRPDTQQSKLVAVTTHDVFGIVRNLASFRLAGTPKDYIIIGSDSGRIAIIEYLPARNRFQRIHLETFGKSGIRRVVPGQFLVADPKGRAAMMASMEKNKVVYILNRNAQAELTISSPLSADKPHTLVYAMVALDVGYENPIFASLEIDYAEAEQDSTNKALGDIEKQLVYYELDLGLNHVVRKWTEPVDRTANLLFQVPGGNDGPSGVLVCSEEFITYRHLNQAPYRVAIPRRLGATEDPNRKRCITAGVMHKMRGAFFFLLQSEDGDLFKVTIDMVEDDNGQATGDVQQLKIKYFDTVPVATNLCVLKSGYLFVATESGNHHFYQFEKLGDDDGETEFTSDMFDDDENGYTPARFRPRKYENLLLAESIDSLHPLMGAKTYNLTGEDVPQIYTICGTGARSSFKTLKHGLEISEIADSELPKVPTAVWTIKKQRSDEYDAYIVLSFSNGTLVLSIGETVEEASDTGFLTSAPTLAAQLLGEDSLIQIHPKGIRHILASGAVNQWEVPQHRSIVAAATNERQVAVALSSGEIVYFELDADGSLAEYDEKREMSGTVTCLSLGDVPNGRQRSEFLAVGCDDATVRILSLGVESTLESKSIQALSSAPVSLRIMAMPDPSSGGTALYLHIGLYSGVYIRTVLDEVTGDLSDTRTRFLGPKPCRLFQATVKGEPAILALTTRSWLGYSDTQTSNFTLTPLNYSPLEWASNFTSSECKEGIVGIQAKNLRIFMVEKLSNNLLRESIPLAYTPRDFVRHPDYPVFYIIQADNNVLPETLRNELLADPNVVNGDATALAPSKFGYPKGLGHWSSCIQVVDPITAKTVIETIELENNEAAVSIAAVAFDSQDGETFLLVGTGENMKFAPRSSTAGYIHVYRFQDDGRSLEFIHKTQVEEPPYSLIPFQGRLLAGIGSTVRLYDLGMRQLLRKAQLMKAVPSVIVDMKSSGLRIFVGDAQEGVTYLVYKPQENHLIKFVDDTVKRWTTCINVVDYETTAGGDKFGNIWLVRCPPQVSDSADEEGAGSHLVHDRGWLHGTPQRLDLMIHNYVQDMPTSIEKVSLLSGSADVLLWSGLQGSVGVLAPIPSREDVDFFQALEAELRKDDPPLAGRDHLIYRSYYNPVKGVIDGDLCERFLFLSRDMKDRIAGELERSVREVERKISEMRTRSAY